MTAVSEVTYAPLDDTGAKIPGVDATIFNFDLTTALPWMFDDVAGTPATSNVVTIDPHGNLTLRVDPAGKDKSARYVVRIPGLDDEVIQVPLTYPTAAPIFTNLGLQAKKDGGLLLDGTDESAAFIAWMSILADLQPRLVTIHWEPGTIILSKTAMQAAPWNVNAMFPTDAGATTIISAGADVGSFIVPRCSRFRIEGMVIDCQREAQVAYWAAHAQSIDSYVALNFQRGNSVSGTGGSAATITGGLCLATAVTAGDTTINLTLPYSGPSGAKGMIQPGDGINIVNGAVYERLHVAPSFMIGNTAGPGGSCTVPLEYPVVNAYATTAHLTHSFTDVHVEDNTFLGAGVQGMTMDAGEIIHNRFRHQIDCAMGNYERGNYAVKWNDNTVETYSYWGGCIDEFDTTLADYAPNELNEMCGNRGTFIPGGPDLNESPPIGAGNLDMFIMTANANGKCNDNIIDMTRSAAVPPTGHVSGVRLQNHVTSGVSHLKGISVCRNTIIAALQTGSFGVLVSTNANPTDPNIDAQINGNSIENCVTAIDLGAMTRSQVCVNRIRGGTQAINQLNLRTGTPTILHTIDGNDIAGAAVGIRLLADSGSAALPVAAGSGYRGANVITDFTPGFQVALTGDYAYNPTGQAN